MKILLVEDEPELGRWLERTLTRQCNMVVDWVDDGLMADQRLRNEDFDAVILDLGLPNLSGESILSRLRERQDATPVLVLTARDSLRSKVSTLNCGADDFLSKPFMLEELEARLNALVRRSRGREHPRLACGPLSLDLAAQRFSIANEPLALSPREFAVLRALIQRSGEALTKQHILDRVLHGESDINLQAVEVLVHRLRKKLQDSGVQIVTLRGLGYCLEEDTEQPNKTDAEPAF